MSHQRQFVLTSLVLCLVVGGLPWGSLAAAAEPEIVFDSPPAVVVRQTNGLPARGHLLRVTDDELTLRALNGKEVSLQLSRIRSVKTPDERFEYRPRDESFYDLSARIGQIGGETLNDEAAGVARRRSSNGTAQDQRQSQKGSGKQDDDRNERHRRDKERRQRTDDAPSGTNDAFSVKSNPFGNARTPPVDDPEDDAPDAGTADVIEILVCANCENDLPAGFRSGDRCPNCDMIAEFEEESATTAATDIAATSQNPFAPPGGGAPPRQPAPKPANQPVVTVESPGMGLADIPLIGKIGIFAGFVIAGWFLLQRR